MKRFRRLAERLLVAFATFPTVAGSTLPDLDIAILGYGMWIRAFDFFLEKSQQFWMELFGYNVSVFNKSFYGKHYFLIFVSSTNTW